MSFLGDLSPAAGLAASAGNLGQNAAAMGQQQHAVEDHGQRAPEIPAGEVGGDAHEHPGGDERAGAGIAFTFSSRGNHSG